DSGGSVPVRHLAQAVLVSATHRRGERHERRIEPALDVEILGGLFPKHRAAIRSEILAPLDAPIQQASNAPLERAREDAAETERSRTAFAAPLIPTDDAPSREQPGRFLLRMAKLAHAGPRRTPIPGRRALPAEIGALPAPRRRGPAPARLSQPQMLGRAEGDAF